MDGIFKKENALVLASGGQDSATCLFWALNNFKKVSAITFNYGQKHSKEVEIAADICSSLNVPLKTLDITFMKDLVVSNLFEGEGDLDKTHKLSEDVPASYVPYRNMIFLNLAAAWGSTIGSRHLITGVCQTDYSGYADCRDVFIKSMQVALNLATDFKDKENIIHTPLMWVNKCEEFRMAEELGCLDVILEKTLTCYNGVMTRNDFGMGCGECPSCKLRAKGYREYVEKYKK